MTPKEVVIGFFKEGYEKKNYEFAMEHMADDYFDHSPAGARSNVDAVNIMRIVEGMFADTKIEVLDCFAENEMVAARVKYDVKHVGICMGIQGNGKHITFEALEYFKVVDEKIVESWGYWPDKQLEEMLLG